MYLYLSSSLVGEAATRPMRPRERGSPGRALVIASPAVTTIFCGRAIESNPAPNVYCSWNAHGFLRFCSILIIIQKRHLSNNQYGKYEGVTSWWGPSLPQGAHGSNLNRGAGAEVPLMLTSLYPSGNCLSWPEVAMRWEQLKIVPPPESRLSCHVTTSPRPNGNMSSCCNFHGLWAR